MVKILPWMRRNIRQTILHLFFRKSLKINWASCDSNFGDILNPFLVHMLSGKKVFWIEPHFYSHKNYIIMGSILSKANRHSIVWGAGFLTQNSKCCEVPYQICAVRGPLTRKKLIDCGIECPEIYGDPALLLPLVYTPRNYKKYKLGIVAHYNDKENAWIKNINDPEVLILDIQCPNPFDFIEQVCSCEKIASSSLHGLITADAYGIPSLWLKFSDRAMGDGFKFIDYFLSVNRKEKQPLRIEEGTSVDTLLNSFASYEIEIDLSRLLKACPFELSSDLVAGTYY